MLLGKKSLLWGRWLALVVTGAALTLVLRSIDFTALRHAFQTMQPAWFASALLLYGLAFIPAAWRWHLVLRLTGNSVHPAATARLTRIGHFLYVLLFGAAGGDAAKSALYARWFRLPVPEVL